MTIETRVLSVLRTTERPLTSGEIALLAGLTSKQTTYKLLELTKYRLVSRLPNEKKRNAPLYVVASVSS